MQTIYSKGSPRKTRSKALVRIQAGFEIEETPFSNDWKWSANTTTGGTSKLATWTAYTIYIVGPCLARQSDTVICQLFLSWSDYWRMPAVSLDAPWIPNKTLNIDTGLCNDVFDLVLAFDMGIFVYQTPHNG